MLDILSRFDILGLGALVGAILFVGALLRVLLDNRSFDDIDRARREKRDRGTA